MVTLSVHSLTRVGAASVALADEALSHFFVLISLVTALCETNPRESVHRVQLLHKLLECPHLALGEEVLEEVNDFCRVVNSDERVVEDALCLLLSWGKCRRLLIDGLADVTQTILLAQLSLIWVFLLLIVRVLTREMGRGFVEVGSGFFRALKSLEKALGKE